MYILRNGSATQDRRLDRIPSFDARSRNFPISELFRKKLRARVWTCLANFDQGREGACVGFGFGHELAAEPVAIVGLSNKYCREVIYWGAQQNDEWPGGAYPGAEPFYEGTSVLAGAKTIKGLGYCKSYRWGFGLRDLALGIGYSGPAVLGLNWYEGMFQPDSKGLIHTTGMLMGGHCILARGVNPKAKLFTLHNSWGKGWGNAGDCQITFDEMNRLLHEGGECCFLQGRRG